MAKHSMISQSNKKNIPATNNNKIAHSKKNNSLKKNKVVTHKNKKTHTKKHKKEYSERSDVEEIEEVDDFEPNDNYSENEEIESDAGGSEIDEEDEEVEVKPKVRTIDEKTKQRLKSKIGDWLDYDDKIKVLNAKTKKYKDAKKQQEELIIKMLTKLDMGETKIDVTDNKNNFRSRVYRHKSVTKEALKENIIKDALMEAIHDEKKVDQLVKKIDSKRPIKERYYLKRTKGNQN